MRKKKIAGWIALGLVLVLAVSAVIYGPTLLSKIKKTTVNVYAITDFSMTDYYEDASEAEGTVGLDNIQKVWNSDTKTITEVCVTEGQTVKAGDKILAYDTTLSEIDIEKAKLNVSKLQLDLENAQKEYTQIQAMKPHTETVVKPTYTVTYNTVETPCIMSGSGTEEDPFYVIWGAGDTIDEEFLKQCLEKMGVDTESLDQTGETEETGTSDTTGGDSDSAADPSASAETEEEESDIPAVCCNLVVRDQDASNGEVLTSYYVEIGSDGKNIQSMTVGEAFLSDEILQYDEEPQEYIQESGSDYTAQELAQMLSDKSEEIKDLESQLKSAELTLKQKTQEVSDEAVYAQIDGTVTKVRTEDEAREEGKALIEISAGGGYLITTSVSEYMRDSIHVGDMVSVYNWESGDYYDGTITEIGDQPVESDYSYYSYTASSYPFTVFVDAEADLEEGAWVQVTYTPETEDDGGGFYLEKMFLRTDNGVYYCYVENDGKLEKRVLSTGKTVWDEYVQIKSGLSLDDYLAFPYGNDVKEGAACTEADSSVLYGY